MHKKPSLGIFKWAPIILIFTLLSVFFSYAQDSEPPPIPPLWSQESPMTFHMSKYYNYPVDTVMTLGRYIGAENSDDVSVCLFIGKKSAVDPRIIQGMKRGGQSWKQVLKSLSVHPSTLFENVGMPSFTRIPDRFRHSYDEFMKWRSDPNREIDLSDDDIRDLVQLAFVVKKFGVNPMEVMKARNRGGDWEAIILAGGR